MYGYSPDKEQYLNRLRRIEGQVRGLQRMVEEDLVLGGKSAVTVTSEAPLPERAVAAALDEAGDCQLAGS